MKWWLRSRRWSRVVAVLIAYPVGIVALADVELPWPGLVDPNAFAVPLVLLLPLAVVVATGDGLASGESTPERVATRPVALMDASLVLAAASVVAGIGVVLSVVVGFELAGSSARNAFGLTGLFLLARSILGAPAAPAIPAGYAAVAMLIGRTHGQSVQPWAWVMSQEASVETWLWAAAFAVTGFIAALRPVHEIIEKG